MVTTERVVAHYKCSRTIITLGEEKNCISKWGLKTSLREFNQRGKDMGEKRKVERDEKYGGGCKTTILVF